MLLASSLVFSDDFFVPAVEGDHYVFFPDERPKSLLVVAHGMVGRNETASEVAYKFLNRWKVYAEDNEAILIVPVFDTLRFGNRMGGYGGYRNLIGHYIGADQFVNGLADRYAEETMAKSNRFYLYGHSAGGQFAVRYSVSHPERVIRGVVSAAGRYSYPTKSSNWPYGAGRLSKRVTWSDGSSQYVEFKPDLSDYAQAAAILSVVIGSEDLREQPVRPSHIGRNRIEFARSWAHAMNENATRYGVSGRVSVHLVNGVGHSSSALTEKAVEVLFDPSI